MKILYTSGDVHKAIKTIFSSSAKRRVAVVAYLGVDAGNYLPNPEGMEIICCPEPGATSPKAVRELLSRGAIIQFSEGLHSKVYWSEIGCVVTSANVSHRALGNAPQKEAGVMLDANDFDIDRLIRESKPFNITQAIMNKLDKADRKLKVSAGIKTKTRNKVKFIEWYHSPYREPWKLGWWSDSELEPAKEAVKKSEYEYNVAAPTRYLNVADKQASRGDWFLWFKIVENSVKGIEWMYVDFVVPVSANDKDAYQKEYPFQAIQVHELGKYPPPPFSIDKDFKSAFRKAAVEYGTERIENAKKLVVPEALLRKVAEHF